MGISLSQLATYIGNYSVSSIFCIGVSPVQVCGLDFGQHSFQVEPLGMECEEKERLSQEFDLII